MQIVFQPKDIYEHIESIIRKNKYCQYIHFESDKYKVYLKMFIVAIDEMFVSKEPTYPDGMLGLLMPYLQIDNIWNDAYKNGDIQPNSEIIEKYDPFNNKYFEQNVLTKPSDIEIVYTIFDNTFCDIIDFFDGIVNNTLKGRNTKFSPYKLYDIDLKFIKGNRKLGCVIVNITNKDIRDVVFKELYGGRFNESKHNRYLKRKTSRESDAIDISKPITYKMLRKFI